MKLEDRKIGENEKCIFYENILTTDFKDGYRIILAEKKEDKDKEYLLLKDGNPIYASKNIENIWNKHDISIIIDTKFK